MGRPWQSRILLSLLALGVAGCGSIPYPTEAGSGELSLQATALSVSTNAQIALRATLPSGQPAVVRWVIASGTNAASLGQGQIDANGVYTAPGALSADSISVEIQAALTKNPQTTSSLYIAVHPGLVQPLLPQNLALTPLATADVSAQIAEVDAGNVRWSLAGTPNGAPSTNGILGTLSGTQCRRGADRYTICSVTYSAPSTIPLQDVYVVAAVNGGSATSSAHVLLNSQGVVSNPVTHQSIQPDPAVLGTSGGNDGDFDTYHDHNGESYVADCCGGTLGALVQDSQGNEYILSNNHVLAESDQGRVGDAIDQPGLIDGACTPLTRPGSTLRPVGSLKYFVSLASHRTNVDAALAAVAPGAVDPSGSILGLGNPGQNQALTAAPPMAGSGMKLTAANLGMSVVKSGRTTGLTCSSLSAVDLTVKVDYYKDCAESEPYTTKTFTNQIGIAGAHFTDSGDSGALVLDASNAQAIGLYFAGGTDGNGNGLNVANPIGEVLHELSTEAGTSLTLVGTDTPHSVACLRYDPSNPTIAPAVAPRMLDKAQTAAESAVDHLRGPGILGTAAGRSLDSPGDAAVIVYVDHVGVTVPPMIGGLRTQVIVTDAGAVARNSAPPMPQLTPGIHLTTAVLNRAETVVQSAAAQLMADPAIFGVGVTQSLDDPAAGAILVLVDMNRNPQSMPETLAGLRVRYMRMHRFHTTLSKWATGHRTSGCSLKGIEAAQR